MKRKWHKIAIMVLAFILLASLGACDLLTSGNGLNKKDETRVTKPEFKVALDNYGLLDAKSSEFEALLTLSLYGRVNDKTGEHTVFSSAQRLDLKRIQSGNRIYVDGSLYNQENTYNMESLLGNIKEALAGINQLPKPTRDAITTLIGYLEGTNNANIRLGYDSTHASYNFKGGIKNGDKQDTIYYATNQEYIVNELLSKSINSNIKFHDYLMFSTFVDFSGNSGWINKDDASSLFDKANELCEYHMSANTDKIYDYVIGLVEEFISSLDIEEYADDIKTYSECINIIKGWISIGESNVTASVNKDNLPVKMHTTTSIDISIAIIELQEVLEKIFDEQKMVDDIINKIKFISGLLLGSNTIKMSIGLSFEERYNYDSQSTNLDTVDQDLFIDAKTEKAGRVSYIVREQPSTVPQQD